MDRVIVATVHPAARVVLEGDGDSWSAYVPGVACIATGHSQEEVQRKIEEALTFWLEDAYDTDMAEAAAEKAAESSTRP